MIGRKREIKQHFVWPKTEFFEEGSRNQIADAMAEPNQPFLMFS